VTRAGSKRGWGILALGLGIACGALTDPAAAARTREFRLGSLEAILKGTAEGVSVTADGALEPAPASTRVFSGSVTYVWALVPDGHDGVYAATGSDGKVFHIRGNQSAEEAASTFEYELFALAGTPDGALYFGGAPNGTLTRRSADGKAETLVDFPEGLIWDLIASPGGEIYTSSGENGEVYRVERDGRTQLVAGIPDAHVVSLAWWQNRIVCGTDARGLLVAIDPASGEKEVLYDTTQEEVVAILPLGERLLFAANGEQASANEAKESDALSLPVIEVKADGQPAASTLYERDAGGLVRPVWFSREKQILSLCSAPDGRVLVGTGSEGALYALDASWDATRLADFEEADILCLAQEGQRVFVGTGTGGAVYFVDFDRSREGVYTSRAFDARMTARWGMPFWKMGGDGQLVFATRSGQTEEPDETWSPWQPLQDGRVPSPPARFLQWRATLSSGPQGGLRVETVTVPYRGPNRAPEIAGVIVSPKAPEMAATDGGGGPVRQELPGGVKVDYSFDDAGGSAARETPRGLWTRSLRSAVWQAKDPDDDGLRYDLYLRFGGEEAFYLVKKDLTDAAWTWESSAWPDGWYQLKVVARDDADNIAGEGREASRLSALFQIDNTPPRLLDVRVAGQESELVLSGNAEDDASRIGGLEFSLDGESWRPGLPSDGICDGLQESFAIPLPSRTDGRRPTVVGVRIWDEVGNPASARLRVTAR
jgi:hypothetical protein